VRVIDAAGEPLELGRQIGAAAPDLIERAVQQMCRFEVAEDELERRLAAIEQRLAKAFPSVLNECEGLAEGAGMVSSARMVTANGSS
jgi:hypothetical protein